MSESVGAVTSRTTSCTDRLSSHLHGVLSTDRFKGQLNSHLLNAVELLLHSNLLSLHSYFNDSQIFNSIQDGQHINI